MVEKKKIHRDLDMKAFIKNIFLLKTKLLQLLRDYRKVQDTRLIEKCQLLFICHQ